MQTKNKFTVCSFFSGGGLFDFSFKENFGIIWANEFNSFAAESYKSNIGNHIVVGDIQKISKEISNIPVADLYIGGPPCTDFSSDGANRGDAGKTGSLVWTYQEIIRKNKPKAFVMENVVGLTRRHKDTFTKLLDSYSEIGYSVNAEILTASDFGTPQDRKRVFIVGIRKDLDFFFEFPKGEKKNINVRKALAGLPKPDVIGPRDRKLGSTPNHTATWTNPTPERILDIQLNPRPNQRVGLRRLEWDKPAYTLTAHIAKDGREFLHPEEDRRLTVRESLRLMGVPDNYVIPAHIPLNQQYTLVGNGVAYQVAKALSEALNEQLDLFSSSSSYSIKPKIEEQLSFDDLLFI